MKKTFLLILFAIVTAGSVGYVVYNGNNNSAQQGSNSTPQNTKTVSLGNQGEEVKEIQLALKEQKYFDGEVTGNFDEATKNSVLAFQKAKNLTQNGNVDAKTKNALGLTSSKKGKKSAARSSSSKATPASSSNNSSSSPSSKNSSSSKAKNSSSTNSKTNSKTSTSSKTSSTPSKNSTSNSQSKEESNTNTPNTTGKFSDTEIALLARIISAEARGEPYTGQVAVGAVIMNRIAHPSFPNTLSGVIYQPGAFSCIADGGVNHEVAESSKRAATEAINGSDPTGGAIYYYNPVTATNQWIRSLPIITTIGKHVFCSAK